ncbi:unnamed protein product [Symbiodinium sp. CCMP2456]|nr:unnamed protein product [Symbiodinium sp. CCMP2456]
MPSNSEAHAKEKGAEENKDKTQAPETLAKTWKKLPGIEERGASGRIILAGSHLTRPDLDANWDIVAAAIEGLGSRPSVDVLDEAVQHFFYETRPRGKAPVPGRSSSSLPDVGSDDEDAVDCEAG